MAVKAKKKEPSHVLTDEATLNMLVTRVRRAQGQLGAVARMLEEGRDCADVVTQLAAVRKAMDKASFRLVAGGLRTCVTGKTSDIEAMEKLEKLFISLA